MVRLKLKVTLLFTKETVSSPLFGPNKVQQLKCQRRSQEPLKSKYAKRVLIIFSFPFF